MGFRSFKSKKMRKIVDRIRKILGRKKCPEILNLSPFEIKEGDIVEVTDGIPLWTPAKYYRTAVAMDGSVRFYVYPIYQERPDSPGGSIVGWNQIRLKRDPK